MNILKEKFARKNISDSYICSSGDSIFNMTTEEEKASVIEKEGTGIYLGEYEGIPVIYELHSKDRLYIFRKDEEGKFIWDLYDRKGKYWGKGEGIGGKE